MSPTKTVARPRVWMPIKGRMVVVVRAFKPDIYSEKRKREVVGKLMLVRSISKSVYNPLLWEGYLEGKDNIRLFINVKLREPDERDVGGVL